MGYIIAVIGLVGSGKSSLAKALALHFDGRLVPEPFDDNAYFHKYNSADALLAQAYFQINLGSAHTDASSRSDLTVLDSTIHDTHHVWNSWLRDHGHLSAESYRTLDALYHRQLDHLRPPDLVIYLRPTYDAVLARIRARGRPYEGSISRKNLVEMEERRERYWNTQNGVFVYDNSADPPPDHRLPPSILFKVRNATTGR